jgi:hypothetical protein
MGPVGALTRWIVCGAAFSCLLAASMRMPASAYSYCGAHDRRHEMRVYYFNSEFWVDIVNQQAVKWNGVFSVLSVNRRKSATFPAKLKDGQNVVGWLSEADLKQAYNTGWGVHLAKTFTVLENNCGRILETDVIFNPAISSFSPQTDVPYDQRFPDIALHELGHVLTLGHEQRGLALMSAAPAVSDVLHHNDKVGWYRSSRQRFNPGPSTIIDMGVFPLRQGTRLPEVYATLSRTSVSRGASLTIANFSVENLSSEMPFTNPKFRVLLENVGSGAAIELGTFAWASFQPFSSWTGSLTYTVPFSAPSGTYRVVAALDGTDGDSSNNRAVFGRVTVN